MIKKIGVLTSGGDAPGMNNAIRAVVMTGLKAGIEVYGVNYGYKGLVEDNIFLMNRHFVADIVSRGGTILGSARLPEFKEEAVREKAVANLKKHGIEALIVIGGDGSYMGAKKLTEMGINCVGLPGTIDNDIASSDCTIGFDTCLNTIINAVDNIRDTSTSHHRAAFVEVMGNHCGDLALYSGLAEGADIIINVDHPLTDDEIIARLNDLNEQGAKCAIVIVAEKVYPNIYEFAKKIDPFVGFECKAEILGRIQRGGRPSAWDRLMCTEMGAYAVECLKNGIGGVCIGYVDGKYVARDIMEALALPRDKHEDKLKLVDSLA